MPDERITTVQLGSYLDEQIDQGLEILQKRNPNLAISREQLIRLLVGYGSDQVFRRKARKRVHLYGRYHKLYPVGVEKMMTVEDISPSGAGLKTIEENTIRINEILHIQFNLEDTVQTVIHMNVIVRNVRGRFLGVAFIEPEIDPKLRSFLDQCPSEEKISEDDCDQGDAAVTLIHDD